MNLSTKMLDNKSLENVISELNNNISLGSIISIASAKFLVLKETNETDYWIVTII